MISKKTKYALKALLILAEEYSGGKPQLISGLAKRGRIPKKFLELILLDLKNHGVLQSKMGKGGGYMLAKSPEATKLGPVMRIIEGPLSPLPCLSKTAYRRCDECESEEHCPIRLVLQEAYVWQAQVLDNTSLRDMLDKANASQEAGSYAI